MYLLYTAIPVYEESCTYTSKFRNFWEVKCSLSGNIYHSKPPPELIFVKKRLYLYCKKYDHFISFNATIFFQKHNKPIISTTSHVTQWCIYKISVNQNYITSSLEAVDTFRVNFSIFVFLKMNFENQ